MLVRCTARRNRTVTPRTPITGASRAVTCGQVFATAAAISFASGVSPARRANSVAIAVCRRSTPVLGTGTAPAIRHDHATGDATCCAEIKKLSCQEAHLVLAVSRASPHTHALSVRYRTERGTNDRDPVQACSSRKTCAPSRWRSAKSRVGGPTPTRAASQP